MDTVTRTSSLFPVAFVIHDGEELLTMQAWIAGHRPALDALAARNAWTRTAVDALPVTFSATAVAIGLELLVIVLATIAFTRNPRQGASRSIYAALLGVFTGHSLTHVLQALYFAGYTPGVVTAVVVIPPFSVVIYRALFRSAVLTRRAAIVSALAGAAVFLPLFIGLLSLARQLATLTG
jgi:hypothetical protein